MSGNAVAEFWVAGLARIREYLRGRLKSGDISYTLRRCLRSSYAAVLLGIAFSDADCQWPKQNPR